MVRWLLLALVALLVAFVFIAYDHPQLVPGGYAEELPDLVYLLMALLLVSGAGFGFARFKYDGGQALAGIAFWGAAIVLITFAYGWFR